MTSKITTEIEWYGPDMVPLGDEVPVLCAASFAGTKAVAQCIWIDRLQHFFSVSPEGIVVIEPERWAYMPEFPRAPS